MAFMNQWLADIRRVKDITDALSKELEARTSLTLNGYYVLYFLAHSEEKKMRLNILQEYMGLSQSAMSRMKVAIAALFDGSIAIAINEAFISPLRIVV